jgi:hypothetical protein
MFAFALRSCHTSSTASSTAAYSAMHHSYDGILLQNALPRDHSLVLH